MRSCLLLLLALLASCSEAAVHNTEAQAPCSSAGPEQKEAAKLSADIVVAGKWVAAEPDLTPQVPIKVGRIEIIDLKKGDLNSNQLISILTATVMSSDQEKITCPVSVPRQDEERIFFVQRGQNKSFRVIDHEPMDTGK